MGTYWQTFGHVDEIDWEQFSTWFLLVRGHGRSKTTKDLYTRIFDNLEKHTTTETAETVVQHFIKLDYVARILDEGERIAEGDSKADMSHIYDTIVEWMKESGKPLDPEGRINPSLTEALDAVVRSSGMEWRLEDLNVSIGPLHQGDFVLVGARPETGKTSFVTSEITHMAAQLPKEKKVLFINNEESGHKILLRLYQSALNATVPWLKANEAKAVSDYDRIIGRDRILVYDKPSFHVREVERILKHEDVGLIVFNVLPKVKGFERDASGDVDRLSRLFQWAREIAKAHAPVIGVMQADGSAEGQKWITMAQLYGSKTAIQGEVDVLITIGASHNPAEAGSRFINIPKNKLPGGPRTEPSRRHTMTEVHFDGDRGRYNSIEYRGKRV